MIRYFDFQHNQLVVDSIEQADYILVEAPTHEELHFIQSYFEISLAESEVTSPHLTIPICKKEKEATTLQLFAPIEVKFDNTLSVEHKTSPLFLTIKQNQVLLLLKEHNPTFQLPILSKSKIVDAYDIHAFSLLLLTH